MVEHSPRPTLDDRLIPPRKANEVMEPIYYTYRDETLTHQVVFAQCGSGGQNVSCNCRRTKEPRKRGDHDYSPMGESHNLEESRALYNNPDNHFAPFSKDDEAKW
jgi:hypothetical protein